jgi:Domain of unknown function (DUF929)
MSGTDTPVPEVVAVDSPEDQSDPAVPAARTARFAWSAVAVILVGVIALVVYALTGPTTTRRGVHRVTTPASVVTALAHVPLSVSDAIGVTAPDTPLVTPTVLTGQPPLTSGGHPEVLYVGAEFCPFCGSERWPLIVALSRFGRFTGLRNMQSAQLSVYPGLQTFSFVHSSYSSRYLTFVGVELYSTQVTTKGAFARIATLTPAQSAVVNRYGSRSGGLPFVDIDNRMTTTTSGYSPAVIAKQSQGAIVGELDQADSPTAQAIVASANYLTAGICTATDQQPASVCTSRGVRTAAADLGTT